MSPHISLYCCYFINFLVRFNTFIWNRVSLNPGIGGVRDVAFAIISHEHSFKPSLLVPNFGYCISKGSPSRLFRDHNSVIVP